MAQIFKILKHQNTFVAQLSYWKLLQTADTDYLYILLREL